MAGLKTIILLSFILAIGFLLVILSSALFKDYLTLLVVATYVVAPIPNWICGKAQNQDDFMDSGSNGLPGSSTTALLWPDGSKSAIASKPSATATQAIFSRSPQDLSLLYTHTTRPEPSHTKPKCPKPTQLHLPTFPDLTPFPTD
ncbi:hypothetical protein D0862_03343 [Hortaea werneckii]|uniref:Uncharacterized protein n=1 Tax=Hortaea werneckii TaxID=91943 RepID=A0A3M7HAN8_HORWE|nr:hypothetical protein D0862_03343 [Hortaea werneckii]